MNPSVIVTDEISKSEDVESVSQAIKSGVSVIATAHANTLDEFFARQNVKMCKELKVFDYYVVISIEDGNRVYTYYDKNFNKLCL